MIHINSTVLCSRTFWSTRKTGFIMTISFLLVFDPCIVQLKDDSTHSQQDADGYLGEWAQGRSQGVLGGAEHPPTSFGRTGTKVRA